MKRFHVHVSVDDMQQSIRFYSAMFGEPAVVKPDYAKWMVDDPRLNFAISQRGSDAGVNHLGIQVDSDAELATLREQMEGAKLPFSEQGNASCCYAISEKWWTVDPQGVAWETYRTLGAIPVFGADSHAAQPESSVVPCCAAMPAQVESKSCCA